MKVIFRTVDGGFFEEDRKPEEIAGKIRKTTAIPGTPDSYGQTVYGFVGTVGPFYDMEFALYQQYHISYMGKVAEIQ